MKILKSNYDLPLYVQVRKFILSEIIRKGISLGDKIFTEQELVELLGVSRGTIRQAINTLVSDGIIEKRQGLGTYLTSTQITMDVGKVASFSERLSKLGFDIKSKLISQKIEYPSKETQKALKISRERKIIRIERIRYFNNIPINWSEHFLPYNLVPGLGNNPFNEKSLFACLKTKYNLKLAYGEDLFEAIAADEYMAEILNVKVHYPLLKIQQIIYGEDNKPIIFCNALFPSKRIRYRL